MPLTYDQLSAVTQKRYIPKLIDNIFDSDPLLARAKSKGWYTSTNGGTSIIQPLMYAQITSAGAYSANASLDTTDNDVFTAAEYAWKFYYANITVSGADEHKNSGDQAILDFVKNKIMAAEMTLKDIIGTDLYGSGSGNALGGLRLIVDNANTVGGIDQSSYSWWQAQENASTTVTTLAALQSMYNTLSINGKPPTVITSTRSIYNFVYALLQPQQRFVDTETAKAGFTSIMFNGTPLIPSSKVPASHLFMLNEEFLNFYYHPERNFKFDPFIKSTTQDAKTGKIFFMGNLGTSNCRMHGKFTALAS